MNHRFRSAFIAIALCSLLPSCNNVTPENYFDEAVLNVNLIDTKYLAGYQALFNRLVELGKAYAAKHHIKVEWQTRNF